MRQAVQENDVMDELIVRWSKRSDMQSMIEIDWDCYVDHWPEREFIACLKCRANIGCVCEDSEGHIMGFAVYSLQPDSIEILRIGVVGNTFVNWMESGVSMLWRVAEKIKATQPRERVDFMCDEWALWQQLALRHCGYHGTSDGDMIRFVYRIEDNDHGCDY